MKLRGNQATTTHALNWKETVLWWSLRVRGEELKTSIFSRMVHLLSFYFGLENGAARGGKREREDIGFSLDYDDRVGIQWRANDLIFDFMIHVCPKYQKLS